MKRDGFQEERVVQGGERRHGSAGEVVRELIPITMAGTPIYI